MEWGEVKLLIGPTPNSELVYGFSTFSILTFPSPLVGIGRVLKSCDSHSQGNTFLQKKFNEFDETDTVGFFFLN